MDRLNEIKKLGEALTDKQWYYRSAVEPTDDVRIGDKPLHGRLERARDVDMTQDHTQFQVSLEQLFGVGNRLSIELPISPSSSVAVTDQRFIEVSQQLGQTGHSLSLMTGSTSGPFHYRIASVIESTIVTGDHLDTSVIRYVIDRLIWARELVIGYAEMVSVGHRGTSGVIKLKPSTFLQRPSGTKSELERYREELEDLAKS